jgi:hypothetical protein
MPADLEDLGNVFGRAPGREARHLLLISRERPEEAETPIRQD